MKIIAIKDRAIDAYGMPIFCRTNAEAIREFRGEVNKASSAWGAHPQDYDLYELGEYDERTAQITPEPIPKMIARAQDLKEE